MQSSKWNHQLSRASILHNAREEMASFYHFADVGSHIVHLDLFHSGLPVPEFDSDDRRLRNARERRRGDLFGLWSWCSRGVRHGCIGLAGQQRNGPGHRASSRAGHVRLLLRPGNRCTDVPLRRQRLRVHARRNLLRHGDRPRCAGPLRRQPRHLRVGPHDLNVRHLHVGRDLVRQPPPALRAPPRRGRLRHRGPRQRAEEAPLHGALQGLLVHFREPLRHRPRRAPRLPQPHRHRQIRRGQCGREVLPDRPGPGYPPAPADGADGGQGAAQRRVVPRRDVRAGGAAAAVSGHVRLHPHAAGLLHRGPGHRRGLLGRRAAGGGPGPRRARNVAGGVPPRLPDALRVCGLRGLPRLDLRHGAGDRQHHGRAGPGRPGRAGRHRHDPPRRRRRVAGAGVQHRPGERGPRGHRRGRVRRLAALHHLPRHRFRGPGGQRLRLLPLPHGPLHPVHGWRGVPAGVSAVVCRVALLHPARGARLRLLCWPRVRAVSGGALHGLHRRDGPLRAVQPRRPLAQVRRLCRPSRSEDLDKPERMYPTRTWGMGGEPDALPSRPSSVA
mmetsp:Transcript_6626/g.14441  ORF Transcript_6626/g.14441 Transcript_6626/m.14441 type:complete len:556 (-) Transcript_6626:180-1847(-)